MATDRDIRTDLLLAGIDLAREGGWPQGIIRDRATARAGCSMGMLNLLFGTTERYKEAVMQHAVDTADLRIIAQGLAHGSAAARKAPGRLRAEALASVA